MSDDEMPRVELKTAVEPPLGINTYQAIPEMVEFHRLGPIPLSTRTLALGRMLLSLDGDGGEVVGLQSYVKTGRWKSEQEPLPAVDAAGCLVILLPSGVDDPVFIAAEPGFAWHEDSRFLRISLGGETALVFQVASCLLAGVDRAGRLTDIWMLDLDLSLE
ncbi:MAG: hypothetical protein C4536_10070 [Actinobacteria bacterium]|jgi:hypothetical protein|nr:MAG: hypothetical protein C4536_10070 [Actinomycetota bacterium]